VGKLKNKYHALLNLGGKIGGKEKTGDVEITFTSGLMGGIKRGGEDPGHGETTIERYKRREKERMKSRKAAYDAKKKGVDTGRATEGDKDATEEQTDLGFDDPFLQEEEQVVTKEKRKAEKVAKEKRAAEEAAERAELELLMLDDAGGKAVAAGNIKHFDMKGMVKAEKEKKLKKKKSGRKATDAVHDFAIDPWFKQTSTMQKLMEEKRSRKQGQVDNGKGGANRKRRKVEMC